MTVYGVTAVRLDANGYVKKVTVRQIDPQTNKWTSDPLSASGTEAACMLTNGDKLIPIFTITGESVPGAEFRSTVLPSGLETIELTDSSPGHTLQDLIHNVQDQS